MTEFRPERLGTLTLWRCANVYGSKLMYNRGDRRSKPSAFPPFFSWLLSFGSFFDCEILSNVL